MGDSQELLAQLSHAMGVGTIRIGKSGAPLPLAVTSTPLDASFSGYVRSQR